MAQLYSVWALAPPDHPGLEPVKQLLQSKYGGPEFASHVTVLGDLMLPLDEAIRRLRKLAQSLAPVTYRINAVGHGASYFQSVFLTVHPSPEVVEVHKQARIAFGLTEPEKSAYFPHLSLLYGDLKHEDRRAAGAVTEEKGGAILLNSDFVVSVLSLWATDTEDKLLTTWKKVAEFPLEGGSSLPSPKDFLSS